MGKLVAAMATSHAFAMMEPTTWDAFREKNRESYKRRYGVLPPLAAGLANESPETNVARYEKVRAAHDRLSAELHETRPDVLIAIGDDQNELFHDDNVPQVAIYHGGDFVTTPDSARYTSHTDTANVLLRQAVHEGFDISIVGRFPEDRLKSHAFAQVLERLVPARDIPIVPIFINGVHIPAPEPRRLLALGQTLRKIIDTDLPKDARVAVVASGGLSHFTAGYPWRSYKGNFGYGEISIDFDRKLIDAMSRGDAASLAKLSTVDLTDHGEIEFRSWLALLGIVGKAQFELMVYEPFYSAIMGIGIARWQMAA